MGCDSIGSDIRWREELIHERRAERLKVMKELLAKTSFSKVAADNSLDIRIVLGQTANVSSSRFDEALDRLEAFFAKKTRRKRS